MLDLKHGEIQLKLGKDTKLHILRVEVVTGDNDYLETDAVEVVVHGTELIPKKVFGHKQKSKYRMRFEPCVRIYFTSEHIDNIGAHEDIHARQYVVGLYHHKGEIFINSEPVLLSTSVGVG